MYQININLVAYHHLQKKKHEQKAIKIISNI